MLGLTFLGTSDYKSAVYKFQDKEIETDLFPLAFAHFFDMEQLKVVVTKEAKEKHYGRLEQKLKNKLALEAISVPFGKSEQSKNEKREKRDEYYLWEMFDNIVNSIPENSELIVDVTLGYRAIPILALSICLYLRMVRNVNIVQIVYGAFESPEKDNKIPVWDLTPFLFLMDWNIALNKFLNSGNAKELSDLLKHAHRKAWKQALKGSAFLPKKLQNLSNILKTLSDALMTVRTFESIESAEVLKKFIEEAEPDIEQWAKPFLPPLKRVKYEYNPLGAEKGNRFEKDVLNAQYEMIKWYIEKRHYQQAITLAREWVISKMCIWNYKDPSDFGEKGDRKSIEEELGNWGCRVKINHHVEGETNGIANEDIAKLWAELVQIRNDINHAGMRRYPMSSNKIIKKVDDILQKLERFKHE